MNYFKAISHRADELNALGRAYLDGLEFMSNPDVCKRLWGIAQTIDAQDTENPDWVDYTLDGSIPYAGQSRNGSIYYSLGLAIVAKDALLRNLLEMVEGRTTEELPFVCLAEEDVVESYTTE